MSKTSHRQLQKSELRSRADNPNRRMWGWGEVMPQSTQIADKRKKCVYCCNESTTVTLNKGLPPTLLKSRPPLCSQQCAKTSYFTIENPQGDKIPNNILSNSVIRDLRPCCFLIIIVTIDNLYLALFSSYLHLWLGRRHSNWNHTGQNLVSSRKKRKWKGFHKMIEESQISGHDCVCIGMCGSERVRGLTFVPPGCVYMCVHVICHTLLMPFISPFMWVDIIQWPLQCSCQHHHLMNKAIFFSYGMT